MAKVRYESPLGGGELSVNPISATEGLMTGPSPLRIAAGIGTLDGSNPTPVITGLSGVLAFTATLIGAVAPADNTSTLTHATPSAVSGTVNVYAWTNTSGSDPTLAASTGTETFSWIALGY